MDSGNEVECPSRGESPCIFVGHSYVKLLVYLFFASVEFIS